ncbi:MAG TPA: NFACT family protein, partial [Treponemataceae bacterium]|nr:NFACT family protein [Treponemataceae bacterium]
IHETRRKVPRNDKPLRFMEFLRSRVKGARIDEAVQLNSDRIVRLTLSRADETLFMYIRLWSGAANIIVTDSGGIIQDVFFRRPKRGETTGEKWEPPAPKAGASEKAFAVREIAGEGSFGERVERWYSEHASALSREALVAEARRRHAARRSRLETALSRL